MNYQQALMRHVQFEKVIKPCIKEMIEKQKNIINDKNYDTAQCKYLLEFLDEGDYTEELKNIKMSDETEQLMWNLPFAPQEYKDELIIEVKKAIKRGQLFINRSKLMIFMGTYIHNKDYEKAVKYSDRVKALSHEFIEDPDLCVILNKDGSTSRGEGAYLSVCNREKKLWESMENALRDLKLIVGPVKDILKAGKKMNKRKNGKKNRG